MKIINGRSKFNSPMKALCNTAVILGAVTALHADYIAPGNWDSVRLYGHSMNKDGFTATELNQIEDNFHIHTIEKAHGQRKYFNQFGTTATTEHASKIDGNNIVANRSTAKPLLYWNAAHVYDWQYANLERAAVNNPHFFYEDPIYASGVGYAFPNQTSQNWWVAVANNQVNGSNLKGVFVDAVVRSQLEGFLPKMHDMMDQLDGTVIYNGYWISGNNVLAGADTLAHADGVFVECFFRQSVDTVAKGELLLDALLEVPENKYIITRGSADNIWATDHKFSLAAYLIIANDLSFYTYNDIGLDYATFPSAYNNTDFTRRLGPPLEKGWKNQNPDNIVYRRSFQYADVRVNLSTKRGVIMWK